MLRISKIQIIKLKNIGVFFKKIPRILGKNAFLAFCGLFILSLAFGTFVFYRYRASIKEVETEIIEEQFSFEFEIYQEVLKTWQEKEKRLEKTDFNQYPSPFVSKQSQELND